MWRAVRGVGIAGDFCVSGAWVLSRTEFRGVVGYHGGFGSGRRALGDSGTGALAGKESADRGSTPRGTITTRFQQGGTGSSAPSRDGVSDDWGVDYGWFAYM